MASEEMGAQMEKDSTVLTSLFHQFVPQVGGGRRRGGRHDWKGAITGGGSLSLFRSLDLPSSTSAFNGHPFSSEVSVFMFPRWSSNKKSPPLDGSPPAVRLIGCQEGAGESSKPPLLSRGRR